MAGVLGQIILCKQMVPDFNQEELCSIRSDGEYIQQLIDDMQEFMPLEGNQGARFSLPSYVHHPARTPVHVVIDHETSPMLSSRPDLVRLRPYGPTSSAPTDIPVAAASNFICKSG